MMFSLYLNLMMAFLYQCTTLVGARHSNSYSFLKTAEQVKRISPAETHITLLPSPWANKSCSKFLRRSTQVSQKVSQLLFNWPYITFNTGQPLHWDSCCKISSNRVSKCKVSSEFGKFISRILFTFVTTHYRSKFLSLCKH
jgi:hypothetical protein